jgi:hypothetical protein
MNANELSLRRPVWIVVNVRLSSKSCGMNFDRTDHASTPLPDARPCFSVAIHAYNEGETLRDTWGDVRRPVSGIQ